MSKFSFCLISAATCAVGCRNVAQVDVKEVPFALPPAGAPTSFIQQISSTFTPKAVPSKNSLAKTNDVKQEPAAMKSRPKDNWVAIASYSQRASVAASTRTLAQP